MTNRVVVAATIGTAVLTAAVAVSVPQLASASSHPHPAGAHSATHVLRFVDKQAGKNIDAGPALIQADDDYDGKKLIGTDEINCVFGQTSAKCLVTLSIKGGFLYGKFTETPDNDITGTITGGAGSFKGDKGTIVGKAHKPIVVRYHG